MSSKQRGARPKINFEDFCTQYHVFDEYLQPCEYLDYTTVYIHYFNNLLSLVYRIIDVEGLPSSCDLTFFKYCIFLKGKCVFFKDDDGRLLSLWGTYNDTPDVYYIPEYMQIDNPTFNHSYFRRRGEDCEVVYCRDLDRHTGDVNGGLYSLIHVTASLLADNAISLSVAQKNTRLTVLLGSDDQQTTNSAEYAMREIYAGRPYKVAQTNLIGTLQGIPMSSTAGNRYINDLIAAEQYIYAKFYEQIGLSTHDQIKKERLITGEINDNIDLAFYNINNIIVSINEGLQRVNKMFGTDIQVYINPIIVQQLTGGAAAEDQTDDQSEDAATSSAAADPEPAAAEEEPAEEPAEDLTEEEKTPEDGEEPEQQQPDIDIDVSVSVGDPAADPEPAAAEEEPAEDPAEDPAPEEKTPEDGEEPKQQQADIDIDVSVSVGDPAADPEPAAAEEEEEPAEDPAD